VKNSFFSLGVTTNAKDGDVDANLSAPFVDCDGAMDHIPHKASLLLGSSREPNIFPSWAEIIRDSAMPFQTNRPLKLGLGVQYMRSTFLD
jgi:hypothetical protein